MDVHCACYTVSHDCDGDETCIYDSSKAKCLFWETYLDVGGILVAVFWPVVLAICAKGMMRKLKSIPAVAGVTFVISILY